MPIPHATADTLLNPVNINGVDYTWPAAAAVGILQGDASGNLGWNNSPALAGLSTTGSVSIGSTLSIGANPSDTGVLRLPNNSTIYFRNAANNGNINGISVGNDNAIVYGDVNTPNVYYDAATAAIQRWRFNAVDKMSLTATLLTAATNVSIAGTLNVVGATTFSGTISSGTNPASIGQIRLMNNVGIYFRNAANNGNVNGVYVDNGNSVYVGDTAAANIYHDVATAGLQHFRVNAVDVMSLSATALTVAGYIGASGTNPSFPLDVRRTTGADWTAYIQSSLAAGNNYGLRIVAGANANDFALYATNSGGSAVLFTVAGDGKIQVANSIIGIDATAGVSQMMKPTRMGYGGGTYFATMIGSGARPVALNIDPSSNTGGNFNGGDGTDLIVASGTTFRTPNADYGGTATNWTTTLRLENGKIAISSGTTNGYNLYVGGTAYVSSTLGVAGALTHFTSTVLLNQTSGNTNIGYSADQGYRLAINGTTLHNGNVNIVGNLTFSGNSIITTQTGYLLVTAVTDIYLRPGSSTNKVYIDTGNLMCYNGIYVGTSGPQLWSNQPHVIYFQSGHSTTTLLTFTRADASAIGYIQGDSANFGILAPNGTWSYFFTHSGAGTGTTTGHNWYLSGASKMTFDSTGLFVYQGGVHSRVNVSSGFGLSVWNNTGGAGGGFGLAIFQDYDTVARGIRLYRASQATCWDFYEGSDDGLYFQFNGTGGYMFVGSTGDLRMYTSSAAKLSWSPTGATGSEGYLQVSGNIWPYPISTKPSWDNHSRIYNWNSSTMFDGYQHRWRVGASGDYAAMFTTGGIFMVGLAADANNGPLDAGYGRTIRGRYNGTDDWVAGFSSGNYGLLLACGSSTVSNGMIGFYRQDLASVGSIQHNGSNITMYNATVSAPSDQRLKKNRVPTKRGFDALRKLRVVDFDWEDGRDPHNHVGILAQELQAIPELAHLVREHTDPLHPERPGHLVYDALEMIPFNTHMNKLLLEKLEQAETTIAMLERRLAAIEQKVA